MLPNLAPNKDLRQKIIDHVGKDPASFSIINEQFEGYNHPNLQLAMDKFISAGGRSATILGIQGGALNFSGTSLGDIIAKKSLVSMVGFAGAKEGAVQYTNVNIGGDQKLACVEAALFLIHDATHLVVFLHQSSAFGQGQGIKLEVMSEKKEAAEEFVTFIRNAITQNNVYRGKIISLDKQESVVGSAGALGLKFHTLPEITREQIILPEGLLQRIERQTVAAGQYSEALKKAKRKLKRGILFHGKPGTGKTLTAMYLASAMKDRSVLIVTGRSVGLIESSCNLARWLAPSMVVIEDVDLIAEERSQQAGSCTLPLLFELMNQMDGLSDETDVLFVLTTNRPEILEPALASRPGRVDQAYEIPLPDASCRQRLFDLHGDGLTIEVDDMDKFVKRTAGASGAFIAELLRKAALFAAPDGDPIVVKDAHLDEAMHELVFVGGAMTKKLLGFNEIGFKEKVGILD